jgi:methyl-accepting chemotaxis protein
MSLDRTYTDLIAFYDLRLLTLYQVETNFTYAQQGLAQMSIYIGHENALIYINDQHEAIEARIAHISSLLEIFKREVEQDHEFSAAEVGVTLNRLNEISNLASSWYNNAVVPITDAAVLGNYEEVYTVFQRTTPIASNLIAAVANLKQTVIETAAHKNAEATSYVQTRMISLISIAVAIVLVCTFFAIIITKSIVGKLTKAITSLHDVCENIIMAASEVSDSASSLADSNTTQAASIEETSAVMTAATEMIRRTADNSQKAKSLMENTGHIAEDAAHFSDELFHCMEELQRSASEITKIVSTISNISFQTNILSMNASVEAARAGDAGRSFSVVAEEVRKLSQESSRSASSTESIVNNNIELTARSVENSSSVSRTLAEVNSSAKQTTELLSDIAYASQEQLSGVEQISAALQQMEHVTQSSAAISEESAAAAEELRAQADHLGQIYVEIEAMIRKSNEESRPTYQQSVRNPASRPSIKLLGK